MKAATALLLLAASFTAAGCNDDSHNNDGGNNDLAGVDDMSVGDSGGQGDLACTNQTFNGFLGISPSVRRLDCSCGCSINPFLGQAVSSFWNDASTGTSAFNPMMGVGLGVTADGQGSVGVGGLSSLNPGGPFYVEGNFDLLVDYQIVGSLPRDAHIVLTVEKPLGMVGTSFHVERERTAGGADNYTAAVGGVLPVSVATAATMGTLEISRTGFTVQARADGAMVTQFTGALNEPLAIFIAVAANSCLVDGGMAAPDAGSPCSVSIIWRNMRMTRGSLVDRNN